MIEMGKKYKTKSGVKVRILCVDRKHPTHPVVGLIDDVSVSENILTYTLEGEYFHSSNISKGIYENLNLIPDDNITPPTKDTPMDAPVWASGDGVKWVHRHFHSIDFARGRGFLVHVDGKTSHSTNFVESFPIVSTTEPNV